MNCQVCNGGPNGHTFDCPVLNIRKDVIEGTASAPRPREERLKLVAEAIGLVCCRGPVAPQKGWLLAAEKALEAWEKSEFID